MDFDFTDEQVMLRNLAREVLAAESGPAVVRRAMDGPDGHDPATWRQLAETGLPGLAVDPAHGGQGLGLIELALVLEEMGRAAYPGPYFASALLAASALAASGDAEQQAAHLPGIAAGSTLATLAVLEDRPSWTPDAIALRARPTRAGFALTGLKRFVPFGHLADLVLVVGRTRETGDPAAGLTLFALPRATPGLTITPDVGFDQTSRTASLSFDDLRLGPEAVVGAVDEAWPGLQTVLRRAAVGASAEMLGAARRCLELSVEYARVREQFGQPIGAFQAIKHQCADMLVEVENSHAATYYAAWALEAGAPDAARAASIAKSYVGEAARKVCSAAIQVHGGIGFTWEYDLHLYVKRAKHLEAHYGDAALHRELVLRETLAALPSARPAAAPSLGRAGEARA